MSLLFSAFAVLVCLVYVHLPFMVLPLYANLEKHDQTLLDAAQDLGANAWQRFWRITFPLSLPGVYAGSALVFIPAFGIFAIPDILGGPDDSLIGNVIKQQFLDTRDWPFGSVLSIVLTVCALAIAGAAAWVGKRGVGRLARRCVGAATCSWAAAVLRPMRSSTCRSSSSWPTRSTTRSLNAEWVGFTLDWYRKLFANDEMLLAACNSLLIALVASAVSTVLGTMAGIAMYRYRLRLLPILVLTPIAIPEILMGVALLIFFVLLNFTLGLALGRPRAHRVLHRLRGHRRARAPGRHGREPGGGRPRSAAPRRCRRSPTSRCRSSCPASSPAR